MPAIAASSSWNGRSWSAPRAQLSPTLNGRAWRTEFQNASTVWPERVRPLASTIVPEIMSGTSAPRRSSSSRIAYSAALQFSVSKTVSTSSRSTPPSSSASACSAYAAASSSKLTLRNPGLLTSGESEAVRLVGPSAPATNRGRDGSRAVHSSAAARARRAAARLMSPAAPSRP